MADAEDSKPRKSTLQGLLSGEQFPLPPTFNKNWELDDYNAEWQRWVRKLDDYIRRLVQKLTGPNIFNELIQNSSTTTNIYKIGIVGAIREGSHITFIRNDGTTFQVEVCGCNEGNCENYTTGVATSIGGVSVGEFEAGTYFYQYVSGSYSAIGGGAWRVSAALKDSGGSTKAILRDIFDNTGTSAEAETNAAGYSGTFDLSTTEELFFAVNDDPGHYDDNNDGTITFKICKVD